MANESEWQWWAGSSEEWMDYGNHATRDDAIAEGLGNKGVGGGDFVIMEATIVSLPPLDADDVINNYLERLGDGTDYYSGEGDGPEWNLGKDKVKEAEGELQAALTAWSEKWLLPFMNSPDMFGSTRNVETISNTVDPDMLPGGHDNPSEVA